MSLYSAPGKLILMGEHAAVYGRPALLAALDLRLQAAAEGRAGRGVAIALHDLDCYVELSWEELLGYTREVRTRWSAFAAHPDRLDFAAVRGSDPAHGVKVALGELQLHLGEEGGPDMEVWVRSEIPVGSGLGSSAAVALAVVAASAHLQGRTLGPDELDRIALEVERRQHGTPSGIDGAAVRRGGVIWIEGEAEARSCTTLPADAPLLSRLCLFSTGQPREPTGAVVAAVRDLGIRQPRRFGIILDRIESCTKELRRQLLAGNEDLALAPIRECEARLEELGVVPDAVRELVRQIEAHGGAAKISGAGALSGSGAGSLLVYHRDPEIVCRWPFLAPFAPFPVRLGAGGLRLEESS